MSRHRAVRNLDLDEELAENSAYDYQEDPYEDITDKESADLENALARVIDVLGPAQTSGFKDREIKDALWDSYFDVESTTAHFLDEQGKRQARALKKQDGEDVAMEPAPTEPAKPMTALQRLAAARQAQRQAASSPSTAAVSSPAPSSEQGAAPPKSKLTALAAARSQKSAASAVKAPANAPSAASEATKSAASPAAKPLSRLQQRVQAAKSKDGLVKSSLATSQDASKSAMDIDLSSATGKGAAKNYAAEASASGLAVGCLFPLNGHAQTLPDTFEQMRIDDGKATPSSSPAHVISAHTAITFGASLLTTAPRRRSSTSTSSTVTTDSSSRLKRPQLFPETAASKHQVSAPSPLLANLRAAFAGPSPDDRVLQAREGTRLEAAERKRAAAASSSPNPASRIGSGAATPVRSSSAARTPAKTTASSGKLEAGPVSQLRSDIEGMGLSEIRGVQTDSKPGSAGSGTPKVPPKAALSNEKVIEEWEKQQKTGKPALSLIVVGHVDAGKSTLMGKLLHELGRVSDREQSSNERASARIGKGSFAYAWNLDSSEEEHARGVTIDIAQDSFSTAHRQFTLLDAPGHRDFIPNMISGSAQADAAILVIDAALGAFEAGFGPNGQTREHALLLRSLGVQQLVVVVNKLDAVDWNQGRFEEIAEQLKPFLTKSGFDVGKIQFIPCGAAIGENLGARSADGALSSWYSGPVLVDVLDTLEPPSRQLKAPLRMPLTNVFKGQTAVASGIGAAGRLLSGVVQVGDRLRVLPGDETAAIRAIEVDEEQVPWAVAGTNATLYLASIDQAQVNIGSVLCTPGAEVPICSVFIAQILVFEPSYPLVAGSQVELFHHSANVPATLTELISITVKISGQPTNKRKPRVLGRGVTAQVRITVQAGGAAGQSRGIPVEDFKTNKEMARILLRREGETVAAGIIAELVSTS
ncbi:hypothetical protein V8E36_000130 [Tilletia maclaganii]